MNVKVNEKKCKVGPVEEWKHVIVSSRGNLKRKLYYNCTESKRAMALGGSSHAYRASPLATQTGMTNKWLIEQGLISVKEQWVKIHYPATARLSFNCILSFEISFFLAIYNAHQTVNSVVSIVIKHSMRMNSLI